MVRDLKWNCFEFNERHYFELISLLQLAMQGFLATMLDGNASRARREGSVAAIAGCLVVGASTIRCGLDRRWPIGPIVELTRLFPSWPAPTEPTPSLWNSIVLLEFRYGPACYVDGSRRRNVNDTVYLDWLLVSLIERGFPTAVLALGCIVSMRLRNCAIPRPSKELLIDVVMWFPDTISWCAPVETTIQPTLEDVPDILNWGRDGRGHCSRMVAWWLGCSIWKIHFTWVLRQGAQAFPIALTFLACRYCYGQPRAWSDWRLSLGTSTRPNGWTQLCRLVVLRWLAFAALPWSLQLLRARARFLDWTIGDSRAAQSARIAILSCIV